VLSSSLLECAPRYWNVPLPGVLDEVIGGVHNRAIRKVGIGDDKRLLDALKSCGEVQPCSRRRQWRDRLILSSQSLCTVRKHGALRRSEASKRFREN